MMLSQDCVTKLTEQMKLEIEAYYRYQSMLSNITDEYLKDAIEEIMYDEYLHAKFLRSYLMKHGDYKPIEHAEIEKRFIAIQED